MYAEAEWKWNDPSSREDIVVKPVQAVAVYMNPDDEIVIRQAAMAGDTDSIVIIPRQYARDLMKGIQNQLNQETANFTVLTRD